MTGSAVSAVVVSYQTGPRLKECLYALLSDPEVTDIVIVDNGNPTDMQNWLDQFADQQAQVQRLSGHGNIGFGAGVNLGVAKAQGPDILVINPDAVLRRHSVKGMQIAAQACPTPWIVGGRIYDVFGREERGPRRRELTLWRAMTSFLGWNTWTLERTTPPSEPVSMPVISGAFFLSSKDSLAALHGFDEGYFLHVEDVDLCRRCREAGGAVLYDPRAGALHYGSTSDAPRQTVSRHKADSLQRYFKKFAHGWFERTVLGIALPVMRFGMRVAGR